MKYLVLALAVLCANAQAQTLHRCGNNYSDRPCGTPTAMGGGTSSTVPAGPKWRPGPQSIAVNGHGPAVIDQGDKFKDYKKTPATPEVTWAAPTMGGGGRYPYNRR